MSQYVISPEAIRDLDEITSYFADYGEHEMPVLLGSLNQILQMCDDLRSI